MCVTADGLRDTIKVQAFILEVLEAQGVSMPDKYYDLKEGKD